MIQFIDKPIEEMNLAELRAERYVQTWIKERVRRERRDLVYKMKQKEDYLKEKLPSWTKIDTLLVQGKITKDEAKCFRIRRSRRERQLEEWEDRLVFADMWLHHMNAYLTAIDERMGALKYGNSTRASRSQTEDEI